MKKITTYLFLAVTLFLTGCDQIGLGSSEKKMEKITPENAPAIAQMGGEWVVITDGQSKKGGKSASSWYLLSFREDSTAKLLWVMPGRNAREEVRYSQQGNVVTINGSVEAPQVNGVQFTLIDQNSMTVSIPNPGGGQNLIFTHRNPVWPYIHFGLLFIGLTLVFLAWRRWKWFTPVIAGVGMIILSIIWVLTLENMPTFRWVKNYTLVFTIWLFWAARHTPLTKYKWMRFMCASILAINIYEACQVDFISGHLPNILNGAAGILSILAMTRWMAIGPNRQKSKDLIWPGQTEAWIIAYDIWNITFSYLNFNEYTSNSIALNLTATFLAIWIPGMWVSARGITLGFFYFYLFSFSAFVMEKSFVSIPINNTSALVVASISFAANFILAVYVWRWKIFKKAPLWPSFGQYRHAESRIAGLNDSIHLELDNVPYIADYPLTEKKGTPAEKPSTVQH